MNPNHNNDGRNRSATPPPQPDKKDEEKKESLPGAGRIQSLPHDRSSGEGIGKKGAELVGSGAEPLPRPQLVLNIVSSDCDAPMHCEQGQDNIPFFNSPIQGICNNNKMLF